MLLQEREMASDARCVFHLSNPEGAGPPYSWRWGASAHWGTDIMLGHEAPSWWPDIQLIAPGKAAAPARRAWQARGATLRPCPGLARQRLHRGLPLHMHSMLRLMPCQVPCCCISFATETLKLIFKSTYLSQAAWRWSSCSNSGCAGACAPERARRTAV